MASKPPPIPPTADDNGNQPGDALKGCLGFVVALIVVGAAAELLYNISPTASYMFVAVVLLGYASSGGNLTKVTSFLTTVGGQN